MALTDPCPKIDDSWPGVMLNYMSAFTFIILFSSASFWLYGAGCFGSQEMKKEFSRYGLGKYRQITGLLEILGALGLLFGMLNSVAGFFAALGLSLLMLLGFLVRQKIGDSILRSFPALLYLVMNGYLTAVFLGRIINERL